MRERVEDLVSSSPPPSNSGRLCLQNIATFIVVGGTGGLQAQAGVGRRRRAQARCVYVTSAATAGRAARGNAYGPLPRALATATRPE